MLHSFAITSPGQSVGVGLPSLVLSARPTVRRSFHCRMKCSHEVADFGSWHEAAVKKGPLLRRLWGLSGHRSASSVYEYTPSIVVGMKSRHRRSRRCAACKQPFIPKRADARTCSNKCRQALLRRRRRFGALFPKGSPACDIDWEHDKDFDAEPDDLQRSRAADWQLHEALRLAREFALLRPGTEPTEISKRWRRVIPRVRATARTERADPRARGPLPTP